MEYRRDVRWSSFFGQDFHKEMKNRGDLFSEKVISSLAISVRIFSNFNSGLKRIPRDKNIQRTMKLNELLKKTFVPQTCSNTEESALIEVLQYKCRV